MQKIEPVKDVNFIGAQVQVSSAEALKKLAFELKTQVKDHVIALVANVEGKAAVVLLFDEAKAAEKGLDAGKMIKTQLSGLIKGGGGGQKTLATAGGQDVSALHQVIEAVKAAI
jgi:alanyl-tRNA synthetase